MKITSEIISSNLDKLESARKTYKILDDYFLEQNDEKLKRIMIVPLSESRTVSTSWRFKNIRKTISFSFDNCSLKKKEGI